MKTDYLDKRLVDLEKRQIEQPKVRLIWYTDPDYDQPPKPGISRIQLHWLDEFRGMLE